MPPTRCDAPILDVMRRKKSVYHIHVCTVSRVEAAVVAATGFHNQIFFGVYPFLLTHRVTQGIFLIDGDLAMQALYYFIT